MSKRISELPGEWKNKGNDKMFGDLIGVQWLFDCAKQLREAMRDGSECVVDRGVLKELLDALKDLRAAYKFVAEKFGHGKHIENEVHYMRATEAINKLLLPKPDCETCGDAGKVPAFKKREDFNPHKDAVKDCPDCKGSQEGGEG